MTEFQLDLQRRREQARRKLAQLAIKAEEQGLNNLASRLRRLEWNVGARMVTATPPGLADAIERRMPKLMAMARAHPETSFISLMPLPRRKKVRGVQAQPSKIEP